MMFEEGRGWEGGREEEGGGRRYLGNVTQSDHTDCLPYAETDTGCYTTVKTLESGFAVDVFGCSPDAEFGGFIRIFLHRLHLHSNNLLSNHFPNRAEKRNRE